MVYLNYLKLFYLDKIIYLKWMYSINNLEV